MSKEHKRIQLSDHFTYRRLGRFVLPSIVMMIFTSIYGIVDGLFVSNFVGETAFGAVNLVMPVMYVLSSVGFMIGTGGSALVGQQLGEGKNEEAKRTFTLLILVLFIAGTILSILGYIYMPQIVRLLGGEGELADLAVVYARISMISMPFYMLQTSFQSFLVTAEKPRLGLGITITAGVTNMVMDYVLIAIFDWGIAGAAAATAMSEIIGGSVPVFYFFAKNNSLLHFTKTAWNTGLVLNACVNGISEFFSNIAGPLVMMIYNLQLLRLAGEDGVVAYGVHMYANFIFSAIIMGFMVGSAPLYSFHFGAKNYHELHNLYSKAMRFLTVAGVSITVLSWVMAPLLASIFVGYDAELLDFTVHAMRIICLQFLFVTYAFFGSGFYTALGCGITSAVLAVMRMVGFQLPALLLLAVSFGIDGVWASGPVANALSAFLTFIFLFKDRNRLGYGKYAASKE